MRSCASPAVAGSAQRCTTCCPNFAPFDVKAAVVHGQPVMPRRVSRWRPATAVLYSGGLLGACERLIFSRRDFK